MAVLRDYLPMDKKHDKHYTTAMRSLSELNDSLAAIVKITA